MKTKLVKEKMRYGLSVLLASLCAVSLLISCEDNDTGTARLELRLTDAPGDYEEVNVDIQEVKVNVGDDTNGDDDSGWQSLAITKGVYDLKKLTNGIDTLLGVVELPPGKISQIRLVLGNNNTLKIDGQSYALKTPSGQQSGLKVQVHQELKSGITYKVLLDFDAARSIVDKGNGTYNLKPVIRAVTQAQDGAIQGTVLPLEARPTVYAIIGTDTTSTSTDTLSGGFLIRGLEAGSYRVLFVPTVGYQSKEISDVNVTIGQVTNVGAVELEGL